jgi:hypothetical protein
MASGSVVVDSVVGALVGVSTGVAAVTSGLTVGSRFTSKVPQPTNKTAGNKRNIQNLLQKREKLTFIMFISCN